MTPSEREIFHHRQRPIPKVYAAPRQENRPLNFSGNRTWEKAYRAVHGQKTSTGEVGGNPAGL
jgi:hypothetical protein